MVDHIRTRPLISAIVPTRNRADRLPRALDSIFLQEGRGTQFDIEIIVVDDASTDSTTEVVRRYPKIGYIRLDTRQGPARARNIGIRAGVGQYVAFLDDDDVWFADKLRRQLMPMETDPSASIVYSPYVIRFPDGREMHSTGNDAPSGHIFQALLLEGDHCGSPISVLLRRDVLERVGYFDEGIFCVEDYDLWLRLSFRFPFVFVPSPVAVHHQSLAGHQSTHLMTGSGDRTAWQVTEERVVERAAALLSATPGYARVRKEAIAGVQMRIASALFQMGELARMRTHILDVLSRYPWVIRCRVTRAALADLGCRVAMASDSPIGKTRELCRELGAASRRGLRDLMYTRRILAGIWLKVATALASEHRYSSARHAVGCALLQNPAVLLRRARWPLLLHVIAGRPSADGVCSKAP